MQQLLRTLVIALALALAGGAPASSQTLTVAVATGPASLDPHAATDAGHLAAMKHVYDPLLWLGDTLQIEPRLAEGWRTVDATTWEFKLRSGVTFHDGTALSAGDVAFSIERQKTAGGMPALQNLKEVKIVAPNLVHVVTTRPEPRLAAEFTRLFIVSRAAFASHGRPVGTGPYRLGSWSAGADLVLERFDGYWGAKEPWQTHVRKIVPDPAVRLDLIRQGAVDVIADIAGADVAAVREAPGLSVLTADLPQLVSLDLDLRERPVGITGPKGMAFDKNPFREHRVRIAVDLALDRATIAEGVLKGLAKPANQMAIRALAGFNRTLPPRPFHAAAARKLLAEAGYPDGFGLTLHAPVPLTAIVEAIGRQLGDIGIEARIITMPVEAFQAAQARGEHGVTLSQSVIGDGDTWATLATLAHSRTGTPAIGGLNGLGHGNPRLDRLIDDAAMEGAATKRKALLEEANAVWARDVQRLPVVSLGSAWAMAKDRLKLTPQASGETLAMSIRPAR